MSKPVGAGTFNTIRDFIGLLKRSAMTKRQGLDVVYADVLLCKVPLNSSFILLSL